MRTVDKNEEAVTPAGIIKIGDTDWKPSAHANRISEIVMVPDTLYYGLVWHVKYPNAPESMPWRTDIQIKPGDIVWHDYMNSLNCPIINVDDEPGEQYKLLNYYDLYVAKRKIGSHTRYKVMQYVVENGQALEVIPLNGYVLCEEVLQERDGDLDVLDKHVDKKLGKVAFISNKNYEYRWEQIKAPPKGTDKDGNEILEVGDIIIKMNPDIHIMLEDPIHARFNKNTLYFIIQRKDIYAKKTT